jgi:hypothetical protein
LPIAYKKTRRRERLPPALPTRKQCVPPVSFSYWAFPRPLGPESRFSCLGWSYLLRMLLVVTTQKRFSPQVIMHTSELPSGSSRGHVKLLSGNRQFAFGHDDLSPVSKGFSDGRSVCKCIKYVQIIDPVDRWVGSLACGCNGTFLRLLLNYSKRISVVSLPWCVL